MKLIPGSKRDLDRNLMEAYPCNCNPCFGAWLDWVYQGRAT